MFYFFFFFLLIRNVLIFWCLFQEQRRLESKTESLESQLNMLEQDKINITEIVAQKDALISQFQNEICMYK